MHQDNTPFWEIEPERLEDNPFKVIGSDWMLITAGILGDYNTMTASGGGWGTLWGRKVCYCHIKPAHYTFQFMERFPYFTLSFFEEKYKNVLQFCGSNSGRDVDKASATGITPVARPLGAVYFAEARLVIECKKIYFHDFDPSHFVDPKIHDRFPNKDYHRMYAGEIIRCLKKS